MKVPVLRLRFVRASIHKKFEAFFQVVKCSQKLFAEEEAIPKVVITDAYASQVVFQLA